MLGGLCEWIFCLLRVGCFAFVYYFSVLRYFIFIFSEFQLPRQVFPSIACFKIQYVICLHALKSCLRILRNYACALNCRLHGRTASCRHIKAYRNQHTLNCSFDMPQCDCAMQLMSFYNPTAINTVQITIQIYSNIVQLFLPVCRTLSHSPPLTEIN